MRGLRESDWATDPWTEEVPEPRPFLEVVLAPPGVPFNAVVGAAVAVLLVVAASPAAVWELALTLLALMLLGLVWVVRLVLHLAGRLGGRSSGSARGFVVAPALVAVAALLLVLHVPLRVGFELSRPHLDRLADELVEGERPDGAEARVRLGGRRVGLYSFEDATVDRHGVRLHLAGLAGFAFLPDGSPPSWWGEQVRLVELGGGWYAYELDF